MADILLEIQDKLYDAKFQVVPELVQTALAQGLEAETILSEGLIPGAAAETQTVLPNGTPKEVRQQVRERISVFAPGGGFVLGPTQGIEPDVPPENVVAMCEAAKDYGQYPV